MQPAGDSPKIVMTLNETALKEMQDYAVDQNRTALNKRVNELGVAEAVVQRQGQTVSWCSCPAFRMQLPLAGFWAAPRPWNSVW